MFVLFTSTELEEHLRLQFDGGTCKLSHSKSSPLLTPSPPTLSQYLQNHLPDFGFADMDFDIHKLEDSGSDGSRSSGITLKSASLVDGSETVASSDSFQITFQLGDDDSNPHLESWDDHNPVGEPTRINSRTPIWDSETGFGVLSHKYNWNDMKDSLAVGEEYKPLGHHHRSNSMIELRSTGSGGSHELSLAS